jgi:hypothetical protein
LRRIIGFSSIKRRNFGNKKWIKLLNGDIRLTDPSSTDGFVSRILL